MVRKLLVGSAQYILGPFGPDTDLRRYGLRLCERGGKNAKKRAAVAVARKLAVLLHRLWVTLRIPESVAHQIYFVRLLGRFYLGHVRYHFLERLGK